MRKFNQDFGQEEERLINLNKNYKYLIQLCLHYKK